MIEPSVLLALGQDLGYPRVRIGTYEFAGSADWERVLWGCPPATPGERIEILRRLERQLMVATRGARARVRHYGRRLGPIETPEACRARLSGELVFYGDAPMLWLTVAAVAGLPSIVRQAVVAEVCFIAGGWSTSGWMSGALLGPDRQPKATTIYLSGHHGDPERLKKTVRHELGHAWVKPFPGEVARPTVIEETVMAMARREVGDATVEGWRAKDERLADALAMIWGSPP